MIHIQKMLSLESGKRVGLRLDLATWQTIGRLAEEAGMSWQDWCRSIIDATPEGKNITAAVRSAAVDKLLEETLLKERGPDLSAMHASPLMRDSAALSDAQLDNILSGATVQGETDFGGFTVMFGHDEHGQDCVWIRNGLRDHQHFAFIVPAGKK